MNAILPLLGAGAGAAAGILLPTKSHLFTAANSEYLSMSDADYGVFDYDKYAYSVYYKRASIPTSFPTIIRIGGATGSFFMRFESSRRIDIASYNSAGSLDGRLVTTATYTDTTNWHHILVYIDSANATAGDRMRLWHDGVEVTAFDADTNPSGARETPVGGITIGYGNLSSQYFDGKLYQPTFFSGSLPSIGDVYDGGSPKDVSGLTEAYSLLDPDTSVTSDSILSADWTDNNTVTLSTDIPT